jgi:hypothetical protein
MKCMYMKGENFPTMEMFIEVLKSVKNLGHHLICSYGLTYDFDADELTITQQKFNYYMTFDEMKIFVDEND